MPAALNAAAEEDKIIFLFALADCLCLSREDPFLKRLNIVTLGVEDLEKSKRFFFDLFGWQPKDKDSDHIAFYDMGGWLLALYPRQLLAEDITVSPQGEGFAGFSLAHNVSRKEAVAQTLAQAGACGARIVKEGQDVFWGGHSGYFQDLDGHYWEVAWNPFLKVLEDGTLEIKSEQA